MCSTICVRTAVLVMLVPLGTARAAQITGLDQGTNNPAIYDPYIVSLDPVPVSHINTMGGVALKLLQDSYKNWTFTNTGQQAPGTFDVLQYEPFAMPTFGGADFSVLYSDGKNDKPTNLDWIQIAYAHN